MFLFNCSVEATAGESENKAVSPVIETLQSASIEPVALKEKPSEVVDTSQLSFEPSTEPTATQSESTPTATESKGSTDEDEQAVTVSEGSVESPALSSIEPASGTAITRQTLLAEVDENFSASKQIPEQLLREETVSSAQTLTDKELPKEQDFGKNTATEGLSGGDDEDDVITTTEIEEGEEMLENGTLLRRKVTTTKQLKPKMVIVRKKGSLPHYETTEQVIGTDIEEEVLKMEPEIIGLDENQLESETVVEESDESLEDGTWVRHKVTTVSLKRRRSAPKSEGRRLLSSPQTSPPEPKEMTDEAQQESVKLEQTNQQQLEQPGKLPSVTEETVPLVRPEPVMESEPVELGTSGEATVSALTESRLERVEHETNPSEETARTAPFDSNDFTISKLPNHNDISIQESALAVSGQLEPVNAEGDQQHSIFEKKQIETITVDETDAKPADNAVAFTEAVSTGSDISSETQVTPQDFVESKPLLDELGPVDEAELEAGSTVLSEEVPLAESGDPVTSQRLLTDQCVNQKPDLEALKPSEILVNKQQI